MSEVVKDEPFSEGDAKPSVSSPPRTPPTIGELFRDDSPPPLLGIKPEIDLLDRDDAPGPSTRSTTPSVKDEKDGIKGNGKPRAHGNTGRRRRKATTPPPTLIEDLPVAWDEAHETFETLTKCVYEHKNLGLSREQDEMMVCDCTYDKHDPDADPCGPHSDCINRAIFIECLANECRAGKHCHNQRFAQKQFSDVEIVQTEMKGFGLRAASYMPAGTLIYEYIGEVVAEKTFRKRMAQYADEGIKHFYFMMLQKEEYIDATKKGGIGRFANHSCNPNSEVQKWVVGRRLRMGIFTKRDVVKGEEITFNYNVDRYGHDAQICHCGEANCVGFIGGKTQTDVVTMDDLFLEALGITDEVELLELKGNKKKRSKQIDEDFIPTLRPIQDSEAQKVAAAMRQSMQNMKMMSRLLERIKMTDEMSVHRQLMRMHGFSLMSMVLTENMEDKNMVLLVLESMSKWKLQIRNKIEDSCIEEPVKKLAESEDETIKRFSQDLLDYWSTLELSYRIPRVSKIASLDAEDEAGTTTIAEADAYSAEHRRPQAWENTNSISFQMAPVRFRPVPSFARPKPPVPTPPPKPIHTPSADRSKLDAIIALAQQTVAAAQNVPEASPAQSNAAESSQSGSRHDDEVDAEEDRRKRVKRSHESSEDRSKAKEQRLSRLVGKCVVDSMMKYRDAFDKEDFKRYAKEATMVIVNKEKQDKAYEQHRYHQLSEDKKHMIKKFTKDWVHKAMKRLKSKGKLRIPTSSTTKGDSHDSSRSNRTDSTPNHANGDTPSATPLSNSTPSVVPETPTRHDSSADIVTDMFGSDDFDDLGVDRTPSVSTTLPTPDQEKPAMEYKLHPVDRFVPGNIHRAEVKLNNGTFRAPPTPISKDEPMDQD